MKRKILIIFTLCLLLISSLLLLTACGHEHNYTTTKTQPTCTAKGFTTYTCECGDSYIDEYVESLGHTPISDSAIESTCSMTGLTEGSHCSVCDTVIVAQEVVAKKAHIPSDWITDAQATYVENGSRHKICLVCDDTLENEIIPSILKYTLLSNDTYEVSGFGGCEYADVVIPSEYNGKPITIIGMHAFANTNIKTIVLPDTIIGIGLFAFGNCCQLENIVLSKNIKTIDPGAFDNCNKIVERVTKNITTDVIWGLDKKIYVIDTSIQTKQSTKLEILPGTIIIGRGNAIKNYGDIFAYGEKNTPVRCFYVRFLFEEGKLDFKHLELKGGCITKGNSGRRSSGIKLYNCSFYDSTEYSYIWYPNSLDIQNCYFENWEDLSIGMQKGATVMHNTFVDCGTKYSSVIECWAAYGGLIEVHYNNFIQPKGYALKVMYDGGIDGRYNWFGTTDVNEIEKLIYDGNDDFDCEIIDYSGYLNKQYEYDEIC